MILTTFNLTDSSGNEIYSRLQISPAQSGFAYSGSVVSADAIHVLIDKAPASVQLIPNSYTVQGFGRNTETRFFITLPTGSDGTTQSAANYIVDFPQGVTWPLTASYALTALTASYALTGGSGGGSGSAYPYVTQSDFGGGAPPYTPPGPQIAFDTSNGAAWNYFNGQWN